MPTPKKESCTDFVLRHVQEAIAAYRFRSILGRDEHSILTHLEAAEALLLARLAQ